MMFLWKVELQNASMAMHGLSWDWCTEGSECTARGFMKWCLNLIELLRYLSKAPMKKLVGGLNPSEKY